MCHTLIYSPQDILLCIGSDFVAKLLQALVAVLQIFLHYIVIEDEDFFP